MNEMTTKMATISEVETQKSRIEEEDMQNDTVFDQVVTPKQREDKKLNGIVIVETLNDTDDEEMDEDNQTSVQATKGRKNEDNIIFLSQSGPSVVEEVEILATAKCLMCDAFTFYSGKWHRYAYKAEESDDAIYLDNRDRDHFNAVLYP